MSWVDEILAARTAERIFVDTLAGLLLLASPIHGAQRYVHEVLASYKFDASSTATVNGWTVLAAADGTSGRWLLQGDTISLAPLGGTSDDWPRLFGGGGAAAALAYKGRIALRP